MANRRVGQLVQNKWFASGSHLDEWGAGRLLVTNQTNSHNRVTEHTSGSVQKVDKVLRTLPYVGALG
jgi:hypothetical protein